MWLQHVIDLDMLERLHESLGVDYEVCAFTCV